MHQDEIERTWQELIAAADSSDPTQRVYRLLGIAAKGVRASVIPIDNALELLIEVPPAWAESKPKLPQWRGMAFEMLPVSIPPRRENHQLALSLKDGDQKAIFLSYCKDLVDSLEGVSLPSDRTIKIEDSITRWGRFFEKCGSDGLDPASQAGLFGELTWLEKLIDFGLPLQHAVFGWKGCERDFHDFDLLGRVVEVKTSMMKEPQQILINNERQLDERGLKSLHLFFVACRKAEGGGTTLNGIVRSIRSKLGISQSALIHFNDCLINAGYLDQHAYKYKLHFIVKDECLFHVTEGFPRIIDPPNGIGSLKYGVLISSCRSFDVETEDYLKSLKELSNDDDVD